MPYKPLKFIFFAAAFLTVFVFAASAAEPPRVEHADAACVYNVENEKFTVSYNTEQKISPQTTVKIMTAIIAIEHYADNMEAVITVPAEALKNISGNYIALARGETVTAGELINALIVGGAADAANVLAIEISGSVDAFTRKMNERAAELGAVDTVFTNPTGKYDEKMTTTVGDILKIALCAYRTNVYMELSGVERYVMPATDKAPLRRINNRNYFVSTINDSRYRNKLVTGMHAGVSEDGKCCVVAVAERDGFTNICVVMGAQSNEENVYSYVEAEKLLEFSFSNFGYIKVLDSMNVICEVPVTLSGATDRVALLPEKGLELYLPTDIDIKNDVRRDFTLVTKALTAPVSEGQTAGELTLSYDGEVIARVALITKNGVELSRLVLVYSKIKAVTSTFVFKAAVIIMIFIAAAYVLLNSIYRYRKGRKNKYL